MSMDWLTNPTQRTAHYAPAKTLFTSTATNNKAQLRLDYVIRFENLYRLQ